MLKKGLVVALLVHESNLKDKAEKFSFSAALLYAGLLPSIFAARRGAVCGVATRTKFALAFPL